jgi:hypothetical protein
MPSVKLSNAFVEFEFDADTGCLLQIHDLVRNKPMLQDPSRARLFRIMCPNERWYSRYADSQDAKVDHIESIHNEHEQGLSFHYSSLSTLDGEAQIQVKIHVSLPHHDVEAVFQMEVTNHSPQRLQEIRFPWVAGWTGYDGRENDQAYAGILPVSMYPDPNETFTHNIGGSRKRFFYKYTVGMQLPFFDISGKSGGISYICYQEKPRIGGIVFENLDREPKGMSMSWSWVHYPFVKSNETWTSPRIGISVHPGQWHHTADRFRKWANSWWKPASTPPRLYDTLGMQTVQLRGLDGKPLHRYEDIPKMAQEGLNYGIEDLSVWDVNSQVYMRPDEGDIWDVVDETQTLDIFKQQVEIAQKLGVNMNTMVNCRLIREKSELYKQIGEEMVMHNLSGSHTTEDVSMYSYQHAELLPTYLSHDGRALCQKVPAFRKRSMEITQKTKDLGFISHFFDQPFDHQLCLSEQHQHESPDDTHQAALEWLQEASRIFKDKHPEAYVIGELSEVYAMQYIDVSWIWEMSRLAPEIMRYTFPESLIYLIVDRQPEILNRAYALGTLVAFTTCELEKTLTDYPEFAQRVDQLATMRKLTSAFTTKAKFRHQVGLTAPADVRAYLYEANHGLGVTVANESSESKDVEITIDFQYYPKYLNAHLHLILYTQAGHKHQHEIFSSDSQILLNYSLPPLEVATWTIEKGENS